MEIRFRDVGRGIVEARATVEIVPGIFINEVTIVKKGRDYDVEVPQKSFKGQDGKIHFVEIISFENEQKKIVWQLEIKNQFLEWRKKNKSILVYEDRNY
ncbi:MAG: hypothetical protein K0B81_08425 [Candidatus Cloacimonetes bacterium]|nr:hypothetical protein [Candidatus Cloacimonadota bacterium]